jgi:hypothetical protein
MGVSTLPSATKKDRINRFPPLYRNLKRGKFMRLRIFIGLMITLLAFPFILKGENEKTNASKPVINVLKGKKVKRKLSEAQLDKILKEKKPVVTRSEAIVQAEVDGILKKSPTALPYQTARKNTSRNFDLNEARVYKLIGTVMVQHADGSKTTALETFDTVQKGDVITVYDESWVIFKTRRGDKFGLDGNTVLTIEEYYFGGPDRQIRLILQKGSLLLKTNNVDSRQSFFEINTGSVVTSIGDTESIFTYDKAKDQLAVQYMRGKLKVIDKNEEQKFVYENTIHHWEAGVMKEVEAQPMDELDGINFKKFLNGERRLPPTDTNMLLGVGQ